MSFETHVVAANYRGKPALDFDDIVDEFELSLRTASTGRRSLTFDCDDIVIIDIDRLRIGLAWVEPQDPDGTFSLVIGTGASPGVPDGSVSAETCTRLSNKILARLNRELPYDSVVRASLPEALDSALLDTIATGLQGVGQEETTAAPEPAAAYPAQGFTQALDDIVTPLAPQGPAAPDPAAQGPALRSAAWPAVDSPPAAPVETGLEGLRAAYRKAARADRVRPAMLFQSVLSGTQGAFETLSQGVQLLWSGPAATDDPFGRLADDAHLTPCDLAARCPQRFDDAEYELYGSLLD